VRVVTLDGLVGWGEATLEGHTEAVEGALQDLGEKFKGWDSDRIEDIWQTAYRTRFYRGGPVLMVSLLYVYRIPDNALSLFRRVHFQALTLHCGTSRARG